MKDSPNPDLLRSCAVGFVVLSHLAYVWQGSPPGYSFALGSVGVAVFFVHTTLVLMMSLERHGSAAVAFLIRRFFRIYPLSIVAVALWAFFGDQPLNVAQTAANMLLVQNITLHASNPPVLWSLPYEVQMYLCLPALYALTRSSEPLLWAARIYAAGVMLGAIAAIWVPLYLLIFVPCFLPGLLAFVLSRSGSGKQLTPLVLFAFVLATAVAVPMLEAAGVPRTPLLWAACAILGLIIPLCRQITLAPLVKGAKVVATYSYGVYITHLAAMFIAFENMRGLPLAAQVATFVLMLAGLPWLAYHCIEKPGIALGVRLADKVAEHKKAAPA